MTVHNTDDTTARIGATAANPRPSIALRRPLAAFGEIAGERSLPSPGSFVLSDGYIRAIAFSPEGDRLAVATENGVSILDATVRHCTKAER